MLLKHVVKQGGEKKDQNRKKRDLQGPLLDLHVWI